MITCDLVSVCIKSTRVSYDCEGFSRDCGDCVFVNGFHFRMNIVLMYNGKLLLHFDV